MLKILIADDHPIIRVGIKYLLRANFDQVQIHEASNGDEIISLVKETSPEIVLMDLNMPRTDPQGILQTILTIRPGTGVIIFSMNKEEIFGMMYLNMGAMGYIRKGCEEQEIIRAIKCVAEGNVYISKEMRPYYFGKNSTLSTYTHPFAALTRKELEVLRHLSKGESVMNICQVMNIGSTTVATHKAKIFSKLRVNNMFELKSIAELYPL